MDLVKRCQMGDEASFNELVLKYQNKVYSIAYHMMGNEQDAYDCAQEAFIKMYKSIHNFKGNSALFTWIYRITTNVCLDELRKRKRQTAISLTPDEDGHELQLEADYGNPHEHVEKDEIMSSVRKAIGMLNEEMRTVIVLREMKGLSYEEIVEVTGLSLGTVKSRISRARDALKKILKNTELFGTMTV